MKIAIYEIFLISFRMIYFAQTKNDIDILIKKEKISYSYFHLIRRENFRIK